MVEGSNPSGPAMARFALPIGSDTASTASEKERTSEPSASTNSPVTRWPIREILVTFLFQKNKHSFLDPRGGLFSPAPPFMKSLKNHVRGARRMHPSSIAEV